MQRTVAKRGGVKRVAYFVREPEPASSRALQTCSAVSPAPRSKRDRAELNPSARVSKTSAVRRQPLSRLTALKQVRSTATMVRNSGLDRSSTADRDR